MPRKKNPLNKNYFDVPEEMAVIKYIFDYIDPEVIPILNTHYGVTFTKPTEGTRNKIFTDSLYRPLEKMVTSIVKRYPKHIDSFGVEELIQASFVHVLEQMHKFKPWRNGEIRKAYSYYGAVVKHFMMKYSRDSYKYDVSSVNFDAVYDELENNLELSYEIDLSKNTPIDPNLLINNLIDSVQIELDTNTSLKVNETKVGEGIIMIFSNWKNLSDVSDNDENNKLLSNFFTKKKIYEMLKDITSLSSKDIRIAFKVFKNLYFINKREEE